MPAGEPHLKAATPLVGWPALTPQKPLTDAEHSAHGDHPPLAEQSKADEGDQSAAGQT
jgi:hypothetical protein